jgi:hypothetical protein
MSTCRLFGVSISRILKSVVVVFVIIELVKQAPCAPATEAGTSMSIDAIKAAIDGSEKAGVDSAVAAILGRLASKSPRDVPRQFWVYWMPGLYRHGRYEDVVSLCKTAVNIRPNTEGASLMLAIECHALLKLGKPDDALVVSKMSYNVGPFKNTDDAIDLICECLAAKYPDNLDIVRKFRAEQMAGSIAKENGASSQPDNLTVPGQGEAPFLKSVKIPTDACDPLLDRSAASHDERAVLRANAYLLVDRGSDAEKLFKRMYQLAENQQEEDSAMEGIARSLRAEDGTIGRANAWIDSRSKN